ncbi:MAG: GSCFA domain-containing protein [Azospirillaceae bacterium]|nr:GSCFA domain-containing protein [Azospirillaceae bacterium]
MDGTAVERGGTNPYDRLPVTAFWRPAVAQAHFADVGPLWRPKTLLTADQRVATFGSCFAQHIGRALRKRGFQWLNTEPAPVTLSAESRKKYNYDVFTCRTGNIYTPSLLLQWTRWALRDERVPAEVWERGGRVHDPFRPAVEPGGFDTAEEMMRLRGLTIRAFGEAIRSADCFVFTLGLTESWWNADGGYEYPACPGTIAGDFDAAAHAFRNLSFNEIRDALTGAFDLMRAANPNIRFILTVSPVPLVATNSGSHVLVATMESKSILRAVAGEMARQHPDVDYFPSYEIINSPAARGAFFEPNLRSVSAMGVDCVMGHFFRDPAASGPSADARVEPAAAADLTPTPSDVACEEELLEAFLPRP